MSEPRANISWGCCDIDNDTMGFMTCITCNKSFHSTCIASTSSTPSPPDWICPLCCRKPSEDNNGKTPLRPKENITPIRAHKRAALQSPKVDAEAALTRDDVRDVVQDIFNKQMENMFVRFGDQIRTTVTAALAPITNDIQDLQKSMIHVNEQYEDFITGHAQMADAIKNLQAANTDLRSENQNLSSRLLHLEQNAGDSNVSTLHMSKKQNENSTKINLQAGKTIDDAVNELKDRSRREKNIIITGIPEALNKNLAERRENDLNEAEKIIQSMSIDCPAPTNSIRLGKYVANKNRNLKVFLDSVTTAKMILKSRNNSVGDYKIFSDQTPTQRNVLNELRAELSQRQQNGETDLKIKYIKGTPKIINHSSKN